MQCSFKKIQEVSNISIKLSHHEEVYAERRQNEQRYL
jgi:hypothetical protein